MTTADLDEGQRTQGAIGLALLRMILGLIILATWFSNVTDDPNFYSADGLRGFFDWVAKPADDGGNGASLGFVHSIIENTVLKAPAVFGLAQTVMELLMGLGLLVGAFTRLFSLLAAVFFGSLFLTYFGGEEWIFTYVILAASSFAVFLGYAGRTLGVDKVLTESRGPSPRNMLW
jgi:uncharacterized membrane protein YphA (DoxX/SURF4 family)